MLCFKTHTSNSFNIFHFPIFFFFLCFLFLFYLKKNFPAEQTYNLEKYSIHIVYYVFMLYIYLKKKMRKKMRILYLIKILFTEIH